eukprot:TRINITY_DN17_c0_g1_i1.p1 TRINITY_DN17_c0_g1~~TRINITY_DN17_c0_g1_i1.p1  ORF type:complete len:188 (-),score=35.68 TRINITY_DN17_c0_g1_i1:73-636(-)
MEPQNPEDFSTKHQLNDDWTWWFTNPTKRQTRESWGESLKEIYTFDTVEDFWSLWNNIKGSHELPEQCTYHLFKKGVEPKWEDPENKAGGQWVYIHDKRNTNPDLNSLWLQVILAMIGNTFDDSDDICGVEVKIKPRQAKICLWTKTGSDDVKQRRIGEHLREVLELTDTNKKVVYNLHMKETHLRC